jgi:hypothetical protein
MSGSLRQEEEEADGLAGGGWGRRSPREGAGEIGFRPEVQGHGLALSGCVLGWAVDEPVVIDAEYEVVRPPRRSYSPLAVLVGNVVAGAVVMVLLALVGPPVLQFFQRLFGA